MVTRFAQVCSTTAAMVLLAGAASAATCTPTSGNGNSNKSFVLLDTLDDGTVMDTYCSVKNGDKRDKPDVINGLGLFGSSNWILADKTDDDDGGTDDDGDNAIHIGMTRIGSATEESPGTWTLTTSDLFEKIMITLKDGAGYAAFLIDPSDREGSWWSQEGSLSHASVFYVGKSTPPSTPAVPLPAAGWMLLAGLGALVGFRRKAA